MIKSDDRGWDGDGYFVSEMVAKGYDLCAADSIDDKLRLMFERRLDGQPSPWRYEVNAERGTDVDIQENALNHGVFRGSELVAVANF